MCWLLCSVIYTRHSQHTLLLQAAFTPYMAGSWARWVRAQLIPPLTQGSRTGVGPEEEHCAAIPFQHCPEGFQGVCKAKFLGVGVC